MTRFEPKCLDQRQHISLSKYAYDIIVSDSLMFLGKSNITGIINRVVLNSDKTHFDEYVQSEKDRIKSELSLYKKRKAVSKENDALLKDITEANLNSFIQKNISYPKEETIKLRLQNDLYEELYPTWSGERYGISRGQHIKAVIEDYARQTLYDRESIYFKETINDIETFLRSEESPRGILPIILKDGKKYYVKPLRISKAYEARYHYLIGLSSTDMENNFIPASFRLSRIEKVKSPLSSYGSGRLTKKAIKDLEKRIKENGVAFMLGEPIDFVVKLTPVGVTMYNSIYHQRPMYTKIEENPEYTTLYFTVTERQIINYFFQFGKEALISSPQEYKNLLRQSFWEAYESYNQ